MAKTRAKKTSTKKTTAAVDSGKAIDPIQRAVDEAVKVAIMHARAQVENLLHGSNDPNAFAILEQLRAEWSKVDSKDPARNGRFEIVQEGDKFSWIVYAANGEQVASSGDNSFASYRGAVEGYKTAVRIFAGLPR